jgi:hypothetical protein
MAMSRHHGGWTNDGARAADGIFQLPTWSSPQLPAAETLGGWAGEHGKPEEFAGRPEAFQRDAVGSFPKGWLDFAAVGPPSNAPQPSAVVINTTDAHGHMTKALATLPAVAPAQGIFRPIDSTNHYATHADVRIDQFGDIDPTGAVGDPKNPGFLLCGCPIGTENLLDLPIAVGFLDAGANPTDPAEAPIAAIAASAESHTWHLFAVTTNIIADIDLGLTPEEGKWYGVEVDLNAKTGALHGAVIDATTGITLADKMVFLTDPKYGAYDPKVDGVFDTEAYSDSELSLVFGTNRDLNKPGLAVVDNIDVFNHGHGGAGFDDHHPSAVAPVWADWG